LKKPDLFHSLFYLENEKHRIHAIVHQGKFLFAQAETIFYDFYHDILLPMQIPVQFDSIEDAIESFKKGEFLVVVDNEDRENEGDLVIAAQDFTPEKAAFMIRYTRYF
jgi:hypothetical protein